MSINKQKLWRRRYRKYVEGQGLDGRMRRSWHHGHVHATHDEQAPATHNERRRGKRPGRNDEVPATNNERRRE
jgi:hypothetical protein